MPDGAVCCCLNCRRRHKILSLPVKSESDTTKLRKGIAMPSSATSHQRTVQCQFVLPEAEAEQLAEVLGCTSDELESALAPHASAALQEYIGMFLGQKVFRRGADQQEYRLFLLIRHVFGDKLPNEQEVCRLFQTTATESRGLIRSVMSKYQYQLQSAINASLKDVCSAAQAEEEGGDHYVAVYNGNVVDELNRMLADIDGSLPAMQKRRNSVSTYRLKPSAYQALCSRLGIDTSNLAADG
jgi:hypothetical protein